MNSTNKKTISYPLVFKTLARRWLAILLSVVFGLLAGVAIGFFTTFNKKVYGTKLFYHVYKIPETNDDGDYVISSTPVEYESGTMAVLIQSINNLSLYQALICENGVPVKEDGMSEELIKAIDDATIANNTLQEKKELYSVRSKNLVHHQNLTTSKKAAYTLEEEVYKDTLLAYKVALEGVTDTNDNQPYVDNAYNLFKQQEVKYLEALEDFRRTQDELIVVYDEVSSLKEEISLMTKGVQQLKSKAIDLYSEHPTYQDFVEKSYECIIVTQVSNAQSSQAIIMVEINVENDLDFANELLEKSKEQIPQLVVDTIGDGLAYCEEVDATKGIEQVNKNETLFSSILFGAVGAVLGLLISAFVVLIVDRKNYFVEDTLVRIDDVDDDEE